MSYDTDFSGKCQAVFNCKQGNLVFGFFVQLWTPSGPVGACFAVYSPKCDLHSNRTIGVNFRKITDSDPGPVGLVS